MRIVRLTVPVTALVGGAGRAGQAWASGDIGRKIVCEFAFHKLNDKAGAEVMKLIKKDLQFRFFLDSCAWPDHPKHWDIEHYLNVPRDSATFSTGHCPGGVKRYVANEKCQTGFASYS
jgi:hypothetical protein